MDPARLGDCGLLLGSMVDVSGPSRPSGRPRSSLGNSQGSDACAASTRAVAPAAEARAGRSGPCCPCPGRHAATSVGNRYRSPATARARSPAALRHSRHQHRTVLGVRRDGEQPHQFVVVEDLGQGRRRLGAGQVEVRIGHTEGDAEEKAHAVANGVAALPAQSALLMKEEEVVLNLLGTDLVGAAAVVTGRAL